MTACEWREAPSGDYAVIGDPVAHSLSPLMHAAAYQACGLDLTYHAIRVPEREFEVALDRLVELGYKGLNATIPLKEKARAWSQGSDPARPDLQPRVGVNTLDLARRIGVSTDEAGFMASLAGRTFPTHTALVCGAGDTGKALAFRLLEEGFELKLWNRTPGKWDLFADENKSCEIVDTPDPAGCGLLLNATASTLSGSRLPVQWSRSEPGALAYDVAYGRPSAFLEEAEAQGLAVQDGLRMLMEQGALAFEWWLGISAPREDMISLLHERTAAQPRNA